jgi:hypothetical protein
LIASRLQDDREGQIISAVFETPPAGETAEHVIDFLLGNMAVMLGLRRSFVQAHL